MPEDPGPDLEPHEVRDGTRVLRFDGWLLAHSSSKRPGAPRWSEITLYRLLSGGYVIARVGRSTVAHAPDCARITSRMPSFLDVREQGDAVMHRTSCPECRPLVGDRMDPQTRLEPSRYRASYVTDATEAVDTLLEGRHHTALPQLVRNLVEGAAAADDDIAKIWTATWF